ncbi:MAG: InlB B-repeat-containing protein [Christensenellales bacterium]
MKKSLALTLALIMVLCMLPVTALAASSTVVLHPATGTTPTGFKVSVGDKINGYKVTEINNNNFEITIDLGTYNVSMMSFRIPLPEEVWEGVKMQYNPQTYVIAGTAGDAQKTPGGSALLGNGKNTFYYYNLGSSGGSGEYLWKFTLNYDANGGIGAPASQFYGTNEKYTKSHTFTLSTTTPTRDGYTFLGWAKSKTATSATHQPGGSYLMSQTASGYNGGSVSETLYAVWEKTAPQKPSDNDISGIVGDNAVKVHCSNDKSGHADETYALIAGSFTIGDVTKDNASGKYSCNITVHAGQYVDKYNMTHGSHTLDQNEDTAVIKLEYNNGKWGKVTQTPVVFNVKCENQTPEEPQPPKPENTPAIPGLTELNEVVKVKCNTAPKSHKEKTFGFNWFSCQVGEVINDNDEYFCTITVLPDEYVESYNQEFPDHTLYPENQKATLRLKWDATDKQWENTESDKLPITFTVKCDTVEPTEPPKPNDTDIPRIVGNGAVKVHCNANTEHKDEIYGLLEGSFDIGDVTKDEVSGEYFCNITVHAGKYVDEYNKTYAGHTLDPESQTTGTITLRWKPDFSGDKIGEWVVASVIPVEFTVKCEDVKTYTVTYKDGVGGTAFKDQVYTGLKLGDATPGFTGTPYRWNYTFTGWKPAVAAKVSGNAVYTAQWRYNGGGWTPSDPINPVPPVVVVPPKTGDMPFWYSIAQFLGLVK